MLTLNGVQRLSSSFQQDEDRHRRRICVYDCRLAAADEEVAENWLETSGLDFNDFLRCLHQTFKIHSHEVFVVATTDRTIVDCDKFEELQDGSTLYMLQREDQALPAATREHINFKPHYNTLIQSGTYEYYASEGQNPLSYTLAELIDNALSATVRNTGARKIEIRMLFNETLGKPAVIVLDNGCGMTSKQLNNWAVYRLSKFSSKRGEYVQPDPVRRSLNSDISFFGAGGKQAAFYIGDTTMMITKPVGSPDVHELVLSKEDFERKEKNKEDVYSTVIRNRKPGDSSYVTKEDESFLQRLIAEERRRENFTAVVITGVLPEHVAFLKQNFEIWTRQLAHVYHYYIHGPNGNEPRSSSAKSDHFSNIDIQISLEEKPPRGPRVVSLRDVDNDMQSLYKRTAADEFEFKALTADNSTVEGLIRYHPFLYDRETYPEDPTNEQAPIEDDDDLDVEPGNLNQARGQRAMFECYWNGRLIPYTTVSEFEWCSWSKGAKLPAECYNRISGVLFTDAKFKVSTNKLTFIELEMNLKKRDTIFTRVVNGQKQRGNIQREFTQWLQNCHERYDKQIKFSSFKGTVTRTDVPTKKMQHPWGVFASIEWDGKIYKVGQLVKSQKTQPLLYGTVVQFLLHGNYKDDVFATGGEVEVNLEPRALHDKTRVIAISKIDQTATEEAIKTCIENDAAKLPEKLNVDWPSGNPWPQNAVRPAGTVFGPFKIDILSKKGESMSRMPTVGQGPVRKLIVGLKVVHHGVRGDQEFLSCVAQHSAKWKYWFKAIENLTQLGRYTLTLTAAVGESQATVFGGKELPSYQLRFTIKEGSAEQFVIGALNSTLRVGVAFDIPLLIKDAHDHPAMAPSNLVPELECSGLNLSYMKVDCSETTFTICCVTVSGKIQDYHKAKPYELKVTLPGMKKDTQIIKIVLLPGLPHSLHVMPEEDPVTVENGNPVMFNVEIHDEAGNLTAHPKQIVRCQVQGLPVVTADCSSTGAAQVVTKPVDLKIVKAEPQTLRVQFEMPSQKSVEPVVKELKVVPSTRVAWMELYSHDNDLSLRDGEKIEWLAGSSLENLFYKLYDEAGREVAHSEEIASKIKVNWTGDVDLQDLAQGKLPEIQVSTQVQVEGFYQVSYQSVSITFHIVPHPDEPARLRASLLQASVKLGETLPGNISLELVDKYDNVTKMLTPACVRDMSVEAEGLDKSSVAFKWQKSSSSVQVTGVRFQSGTPGPRELHFTCRSYKERVIVKVTAGVPAHLKLISEPEKALQVLNDRGIATPFVVQLCDAWGNPSPDQRVVVELKSSPPTLKITAAVTSQPVNAEGNATFIVKSLSGPKGYYQLEFKGSFNRKPIPGPSVNLTVIPDPNKPVGLSVKYDTTVKFPAGGTFPVFAVTVVSDEGIPMMTVNPASLSMLLWKGGPAGKTPPQGTPELKCSKPLENEKNDCYRFRDKDIPELAGKHTVQFSLRTDKILLFSDQIAINVVANQPVKLGPDSQPSTPVVSYSKDLASRILVEDMTLRIRDLYGNPAGQDQGGEVMVFMKNSGNSNKRLPLFEGKTNSLKFSLEDGKVHIPRLAVMENSPGENGSSYILVFKPERLMLSNPLAAFELPFHFYNDVENQQKMSELTRKRDKIKSDIAAYENIFNTSSQLLQLMTNHHRDAVRKETDQRRMLSQSNMSLTDPVSPSHIERLIEEKTAEVDRIQRMPRRVCAIRDNFRGQLDVLGMVGHLALVQDDAAARVISWHISGDMNCVITRTTEAAKRIYDDTRGLQQVLALDSVYVSPGNRPLPHIKNGFRLFDPPGNPVHARELLIYPQDQESCDIVFKNLLGDTILIDDLDSANNYRRAVVQNRVFCPTILTRQGDRVSAKGKFGGRQNKAPPMNELKVFGAPLPQPFHTLIEQRELLRQYRLALQKRDTTANDLDDLITNMNSPDAIKKQQDMREKERQLQEIETQLASVQPLKRVSESAGEPSGIITKRARQR